MTSPTKNLVLIDADSLLYKAGATRRKMCVPIENGDILITEDEDRANRVAVKYSTKYSIEDIPLSSKICEHILSSQLDTILSATKADDYILYIGGDQSNSHKNIVYPFYKANRTTEKPKKHTYLKKYLIKNYFTIVCDGWEADDALVYDYYDKGKEPGQNTIIAAMDKDILRFVPGVHYNYDRKEWVTTTKNQSIDNFACAVVSGDGSDNIKGLHGFGEVEYKEDGSIAITGRTAKSFTDGLKTLSSHEVSYTNRLKVSYRIYCDNLKHLSKTEIQRKFIINCHLLWVPVACCKNINSLLDFNEIFRG